jgi:hypothetical protein
MSDTPKPPESVEPAAQAKGGGAVAAICDALKDLFSHAPKQALGWVCAGVATFVVLCGVGIMAAFIMYGWPTMADKELQNLEVMTTKSGVPTVEVRSVDKAGVMSRRSVEVPLGESDPKAWATKEYGVQRPLKRIPMIPVDDKLPTTEPDTQGVPK